MFTKYRRTCELYRVATEFQVAEHDSVAEALVEQISRLQIRMLVMGAAPRCLLLRKVMGPRMFEHVARNAPDYCNVLVISNKSLISVHNSTGPPPSPPPAPDPPSSCNEIRSSATFGEIEEEWSGDGDLPPQYPTRPTESSGEIVEEWSGDGSVVHRTPVGRSKLPARYPARPTTVSSGGIAEEWNADGGLVHRTPIRRSGLPPQTPARPTERNNPSVQPFRDDNGLPFWTALEQFPSDQICSSSLTGFAETTSGHGMTEEDAASSYSSPEPAIRFSPRDVGRLGRAPSAPTIDMLNYWSDVSAGSVGSYQAPRADPRPQGIEILRKSSENALRLLRKAQEDAKFQAMERQKAEMSAAVIAIKVKEFEMKKEGESRKLTQALEAIEVAKQRITEETKKRMETLQAVEEAKKQTEEERTRRIRAEAQSREHAEARKAAADALKRVKQRYREYTFAELVAATNRFSVGKLIGEGTYGTVFKGTLQNVSVAIKVLRDNVFQWERKLEQEVELLGRIHHPHVVLLLGCCTQNGCLVYEYMANGTVEDRLFRKDNTNPLPWHARIRILAEVATALLFLHSTNPEPIVHRDLKPGNIFLDQNYVSKVGNVGLARLIPPRSADRHTFYARDTTPLGTLAYMDPEYQQTGVVSPKSDVYALGIVILQLLTGRPPLGVIKLVKEALDSGAFSDVLDQTAGKWPVEEAKLLAKMALRCSQLLRGDRPDLEKVVLPCLETMRVFAEQTAGGASRSHREEDTVPPMFFCPITQEIMDNPVIAADGYTYEMQDICRWLAANDTSPMTNLVLEHKNVTANYNLRSAIREWKDSQH
ncbi:hypothetical protein O6H91_06G105400 [Diphasiastrum complanatum]|nr:hypothetical protein O6H91_06G105400 [Diphasiastrum complanatum]KAJ7553616.1 hypothetical protein O6H91_06G105400 [Diphasiastrum complanatum]